MDKETRQKLRKEIEEELEKIKPMLQKEPDVEYFKDNYKKYMEENEELDKKLKRARQIPPYMYLRIIN